MKGFVAGVLAVAATAAPTLKVTWKDCSDGSYHAKITSFTPATITPGSGTTTMTGSGNVDEDVAGATFDTEMNGVIHLLSCKGDASKTTTCNLPLGAGKLTFDGMTFPLKKGPVQVKVDLTLSSSLPSSLLKTKTVAQATGTNGDKLFCIEIDTEPEARRRTEVLSREATEKLGVVWRGNSSKTNSHTMLGAPQTYPKDFSWCNKDGKSYCTMSRNQHIPQYCGSCWAHGAISALGDRVKIARGAEGVDVNLAVQHVLNCGNVGSCHGGTIDGTYQWIHSISEKTGTGISYETANPYLACSSESKEGFCPHVDTTCKPLNVARTCGSFDQEGGSCTGLSNYPNVTISEYGSISGKEAMMKEIYNRGPIACGIDAMPLLNFETGIAKGDGGMVDHVISVVGWGTDSESDQQYWIVRNSWGEYWGDMGYVRVAFGALSVEEQCSWAVPNTFTALEKNNQVHCHEGGDNCKAKEPVAGVSAVAATAAPTLKVTWKDCSDGSYHAKITSFTPATITPGSGTTTMTGSGNVDEDVAGATFDTEMNGVIHLLSCKGDASKTTTCNLPLGAGKLTFDGMTFPLKKGPVQVKVDLTLSSSLPSSLLKTKTVAQATGTNGDKLFCIEIDTEPEAKEPTLTVVV